MLPWGYAPPDSSVTKKDALPPVKRSSFEVGASFWVLRFAWVTDFLSFVGACVIRVFVPSGAPVLRFVMPFFSAQNSIAPEAGPRSSAFRLGLQSIFF